MMERLGRGRMTVPQINEILRHMKDLDASDVHLVAGTPVTYRIRGDLVPANERVLSLQPAETTPPTNCRTSNDAMLLEGCRLMDERKNVPLNSA